MFGGTQDGNQYPGDNFICYLPENGDGYQILFLLEEAFRRKLTFTIKKNKAKEHCIQWNGISHKLSFHGGIVNNGYPDE